MKKNILLISIVFFVGIQFIRIDKSNPVSRNEEDFIFIYDDNPLMTKTIQVTCYDCHSNKTKYPWYSNISPISWWIKHHIKEGREHLNFSQWTDYSKEKQMDILLECAEELSEKEMPLKSYELLHTEAKLSTRDRILLADWFKENAAKD